MQLTVDEFFATENGPIEKTNEFVRMTFFSSNNGVATIILTPSAYEAMVRLILDGAVPLLH